MANAGRKRTLPQGVKDRTDKGKGFQVDLGRDATGKRMFRNFKERDAAIDFKIDFDARRLKGDPSLLTRNITFGEYAPIAAVTAAVPGKRKTQTAERDEVLWCKHIAPYFDARRLRSVTPDDMKAWVGKLNEVGLNPSTVRRLYGMVARLFLRAQRAGYVVTTPCLLEAGELPRGSTKKRGVAAGVEVVEAFQAELPERYRPMVPLCVWGGLRLGEACGLHVRDFDADTGTVTINGTMVWLTENGGRGTYQPEAKTPGSETEVGLPTDVADQLREHVERFTDGQPGSLIFTTLSFRHPGRLAPIAKRNFYRLWARARDRANTKLREAGLPELPADWTTHSQRRTGITWASDAGESLNDLQALARHADKRTTLIYIQQSERAAPKVNSARPSAKTA